jgi:DNA polymerase-3 subunit beta
MVATDGHRLAHVEKTEALEDVNEEIRVLVPKKAMGELVRMISESADTEKVGFSRDENHLFFDLGKRLLVSRMLTGQFPNFEAVLPRNNDRTFAVNREELLWRLPGDPLTSITHRKNNSYQWRSGITASHLTSAKLTTRNRYNREKIAGWFNYQYLLIFLQLTMPRLISNLKTATPLNCAASLHGTTTTVTSSCPCGSDAGKLQDVVVSNL